MTQLIKNMNRCRDQLPVVSCASYQWVSLDFIYAYVMTGTSTANDKPEEQVGVASGRG